MDVGFLVTVVRVLVGHVAFRMAEDRLLRPLSLSFTVDAVLAHDAEELLPALFGIVHEDQLSCFTQIGRNLWQATVTPEEAREQLLLH